MKVHAACPRKGEFQFEAALKGNKFLEYANAFVSHRQNNSQPSDAGTGNQLLERAMEDKVRRFPFTNHHRAGNLIHIDEACSKTTHQTLFGVNGA